MIMEINLDISTIMEIYDTMQFGKGVVSPLNYKEAIVEIVGKIHSERILKRIYKFVLKDCQSFFDANKSMIL